MDQSLKFYFFIFSKLIRKNNCVGATCSIFIRKVKELILAISCKTRFI